MSKPSSPAQTRPRAPSAEQSEAVAAAGRQDYTHYLARQMGPMIHALMLVGSLAYVVALVAGSLLRAPILPLWLRLVPVAPLLLGAVIARGVRQPHSLSVLALSCVLWLEIGINLGSYGRLPGQPWILPGLLLPIASSMIWMYRWDFAIAMVLCALGPLPALLFGGIDHIHIVQYSIYMLIAVGIASVLRSFMARTLYAQYQLEQRLREQAHHDGLTGLLRRNRFLDEAQRALAGAPQGSASMLFLDTDNFKQLNDDHGHATGDEALMALADVLRAQTRPGDLIGRIGGEEFAMLLPGLNLSQVHARAEQLRLAVHGVARPDGPLTASIGIAARRHTGETVESMLARADHAMRQAKLAGRDRVAGD
jgi:diguanylate cyclase (GGDEF)-like protein